eukprot:TRINITY_DN3336_c0_g1_i2.p1 TRINITY_DN3336_c0_g1~~TRINITY_DN3336_c0_g1_i2.p1  ORF type:complete len:419 (-),score=51.97 TRINITY_DN3336_c0_g1_i2:1279-2535(-)
MKGRLLFGVGVLGVTLAVNPESGQSSCPGDGSTKSETCTAPGEASGLPPDAMIFWDDEFWTSDFKLRELQGQDAANLSVRLEEIEAEVKIQEAAKLMQWNAAVSANPLSGKILHDCLIVSLKQNFTKGQNGTEQALGWGYDINIDWGSHEVQNHFKGKTDVYIFSHGWLASMDFGPDHPSSPLNTKDGLYPRMTRSLAGAGQEAANTAYVCIVWPSGGGSTSLVDKTVQIATFWQMRQRALAVGTSAGGQLLRDLHKHLPVAVHAKLHLVGHSFGCAVLSAAVRDSKLSVTSLVLLQAAISSRAFSRHKDIERQAWLESDPTPEAFTEVPKLVSQALVVISSKRDDALPWYRKATKLSDFWKPGDQRRALGLEGPYHDKKGDWQVQWLTQSYDMLFHHKHMAYVAFPFIDQCKSTIFD